MNELELERIEIELLLESLNKRYGYDFKSYTKASITRRIIQFKEKHNYKSISAIIPELLRGDNIVSELVQYLSIPVSEMFRDPWVFSSLRKNVLPFLKTYPHVKIWVAGCATGEEVYSIAILLKEENLLNRTQIYGTDFNDASLEKAKKGIYDLKRIQSFTGNYLKSGGSEGFSSYYQPGYGNAIMDESLKKSIVFANHNLVSDKVFGEMNLVLCRNVLIYFDRNLQDRVLNLLSESLNYGGFLCLGTKESLSFSSVKTHFNIIDSKSQIYEKKIL